MNPSRTRSLSLLATALLGSLALAGCMGTPTPPPNPTGGKADLTVHSSAWSYEYPGGIIHSVRGEWYLVVNLTVKNNAGVPMAVLGAEFAIVWQGESVGIPAIATTLVLGTVNNGQSARIDVAFLATEVKTPSKIEFRQTGSVDIVSANVPSPSAFPVEVAFSSVTLGWSRQDGAGNNASSGNLFFTVNATFENHYDSSVSLALYTFEVVDANGTDYTADYLIGGGSINAGANQAIKVYFEVPRHFAPTAMHFDAILGPWTDLNFSAPAAPRPQISLESAAWSNGTLAVTLTAVANLSDYAPSDLTVVVVGPTGIVHFSGPVGAGIDVAGTTVNVSYFDGAVGGVIEMTDHFMITLSPSNSTAVQAGTFRVLLEGEVLGSMVLP